MNYRDFEHIGSEIRDLVQSAIDSSDFSRLNSAINQSLDAARQAFRSASASGSRFWEQGSSKGPAGDRARENAPSGGFSSQKASPVRGSSFTNYGPRKAADPRFALRPRGQAAGLLLASVGYSFAGIFGLSSLLLLLSMLFTPLPSSAWIAVILMLAFFGGSMIAGTLGWKSWKLTKRFQSYRRILGSRAYCSVEELAQLAHRKQAALVSDLNRMIEKGMFPQGHLDKNSTCLILTDEMFQQYCAAERELARRQRAEALDASAGEASAGISRECRQILADGEDYIRHIHRCNDLLPGPEISKKLERLELIMTKIFHQLEKNPELAPDLHKFMNYYLPTTRKLLDAYCELDAQPVKGENIAGTKLEIERTLDTINEAFENLLDRFFEDTAWDIASDISVMKTMMAQEGLTEDALAKVGKERKESNGK